MGPGPAGGPTVVAPSASPPSVRVSDRPALPHRGGIPEHEGPSEAVVLVRRMLSRPHLVLGRIVGPLARATVRLSLVARLVPRRCPLEEHRLDFPSVLSRLAVFETAVTTLCGSVDKRTRAGLACPRGGL